MDNRTEKRRVGDFGEGIALKFLMKHSFTLLERNYLRPWGEIDLIVKKAKETHFIEVKTSVSYEMDGEDTKKASREISRPEDNIHPMKLRRMHKAIQTYCMQHDIGEEEIFVDAIIVKVSRDYTKAKVTFIDNVL